MPVCLPDLQSLNIVVACADRRIPFGAPGGASVHLRALSRGFSEHGAVEAWMARVDPGARGPAIDPPVPTRLLPRARFPGALRKNRRWDAAVDARAARRAARRLHRERPVDLVYERAALFSRIGRLRGAARVVELNAPLAFEAAWFEGVAPHPSLLAAEARSLADADLVVVVSAPLRDYAVRRGVPADRVLVLPNGADPSPEAPVCDDLVLGYAGTFKPWHGLLDSLEALRRLNPVHLDLWGDGPERAAFLAALDLPHTWHGWGDPAALLCARQSWSAAWVPAAPWPPPGDVSAFGEPPPERYHSPLKEAEAAAAGLQVWRGAGPLELLDPPRSWGDLAGEILAALEARAVPCRRGSWLNAPALQGRGAA